MCQCEPLDPYRQTTRRARKQRTCDECHRPIKRGASYQQCDGLGDGHWYHFSVCALCYELLQYLDDEGCLCFGELKESLCYLEPRDLLSVSLSAAAQGHALGLMYGWDLFSEDATQRRLEEWRARQSQQPRPPLTTQVEG